MLEVFLSSSDRWDGPWWGGIVFFLFFALMVGLFLFKAFWWRPWRRYDAWMERPGDILKRRLASGQITEAEYKHLVDVLNGSGAGEVGGR